MQGSSCTDADGSACEDRSGGGSINASNADGSRQHGVHPLEDHRYGTSGGPTANAPHSMGVISMKTPSDLRH